jgi:hypothetical protein
MSSMSQGRVGPLFDAMAEDVTWRWMGVSQWSRTFEGKQLVMDTLSEERGKRSARHRALRCIASTVTATSWW